MRTSRILLAAAGAALAVALGAAAQAKPAASPIAKTPCEQTDARSVATWRGIAPYAGFDVFADPFWTGRFPFSDVDRIATEMDRRMAEFWRRIDELERAAADPGAGPTAAGGAGFCAEAVTVIRTGDGPARVERRVWGNCADPGGVRAEAQPAEDVRAPERVPADPAHI